MWRIFLVISRDYGNTSTTNTNFITGFTSKDDAVAAVDQIKKDEWVWLHSLH